MLVNFWTVFEPKLLNLTPMSFYNFSLGIFFKINLNIYFYYSFNKCLDMWAIQVLRYEFRCIDMGSSLPPFDLGLAPSRWAPCRGQQRDPATCCTWGIVSMWSRMPNGSAGWFVRRLLRFVNLNLRFWRCRQRLV